MDKKTIYSKTAKGLAELKTSTRNLSREQIKALIMVNGKASIGDFIRPLSENGRHNFIATLRELEQMGLVRALADLPGSAAPKASGGGDEFDFEGAGLPVIEVTELSGEESVQAWAEARRGVKGLQEKGFFAHFPNAGATEAANAVAAGRVPAQPLQALVIEDDPAIVQLLELLLSEKGFVVHSASDIKSAMSVLDGETAFDLVLLDVVLPGIAGKDGFHILEFIRKSERLHRLPVIMVTSQISDEYVLRGLKAGSDGYIFKPFKWETLYQCIRSVIGV